MSLSRLQRLTPVLRSSRPAYSARFVSLSAVRRSEQAQTVYEHPKKQPYQPSAISRAIRASPIGVSVVKGFGKLLGSKQTAINATEVLYADCMGRDLIEADFLHDECKLPKTFQTWFQITNLHVWLLTVRFRAMEPPYGRKFVQSLLDHFFADTENRIREVLGPRASERTVVGYMKEYRDLWKGTELALDSGLVGSDCDLSAAVWRNIFDARGWDLGGKLDDKGTLVEGSSAEAVLRDVKDADLPYHIFLFVAYLRRETARLATLSDEEVIQARVPDFGRIKEADLISDAETPHESTQPLSERTL